MKSNKKSRKMVISGIEGSIARWGARRPPAIQIRVDADVGREFAEKVRESDRRKVATDAISRATLDYVRKNRKNIKTQNPR